MTLLYSGGRLTFINITDLMGGVLLQGDVDLFAALRLYNKIICQYVHPLKHWETGRAWKLTIPIHAALGGGRGGTGGIGPIKWGPIPIKDIETAIRPLPSGWNCLSWAEIKKFLCEKKVLPPELCERPGELGILRNQRALAICKCVGDPKCGGGKLYRKCFYVNDTICKKKGELQKVADDLCNHNPDLLNRCVRPDCRFKHTDAKCPVKDDVCKDGYFGAGGPIIPKVEPTPRREGTCNPVAPIGVPTVTKPASSNDCLPANEKVNWDVISIDANNWGVCATSLVLSGKINIKPWPSHPKKMVVPNTPNPVDGGNINNIAGSRNHWKFVIDDMADYDTTGLGGAGKYWHSTDASEAHEWEHWNADYKADSVLSAAGGHWSQANKDLNALRESKANSPTPVDARKAFEPKAKTRISTFVGAVTRRWNHLATTDKPGKGGRGYAAGMRVLNGLIRRVRAYKDRKSW